MTRPVVYSASSVNAYQTCHLQWYFGYVMAEPGIVSEPQMVGIAVHDWAEYKLRALRTEQGHPSMRTQCMIPMGETKQAADVFDRDILPTYREPVLIEQPFQIEVDGIPFSGVIDSVDRQDIPGGEIADWTTLPPDTVFTGIKSVLPGHANILRDLKTTGKRPPAGKYWFNMVGYFLGARDLGFEIDIMQLDYIVRTQHPYYWPEVVPAPDMDDLTRWANVLQEVAGGVERADYEPTGLGTYVCKFCPYRTICGPYTRFKEVAG
jgi:hypothetical protein